MLFNEVGVLAHAITGVLDVDNDSMIESQDEELGLDPGIRLMEGADFFCRVMHVAGACFVDRLTLHYRIFSPSLMHDPDPRPKQRAAEREGLKRFRTNYRRLYGTAKFLALAALSRTVPKVA